MPNQTFNPPSGLIHRCTYRRLVDHIMAHDIFISYSTPDKETADAVCATLEDRQIKCWIAPRDILPGASWAEAIMDAIKGSKIMILVFSANANQSQQVMREVERAVNESVVIIPFRIEDVPFSKALAYFISTCHWLDATTSSLEDHVSRLADTAALILSQDSERRESSSIAKTKDPRSRVFFNNSWDGFNPETDKDVLFYLDLVVPLTYVRHIQILRNLKEEAYHFERGIAARPDIILEPFEESATLHVCFGASETGIQSEEDYHRYFKNCHPVLPVGLGLLECDGNEEAMWEWTTTIPASWLQNEHPFIRREKIPRLRETVGHWITLHNDEMKRIRI